MDINQQKEQFSNAYVRAIAAVAGYCVYQPEVDDDSIDLGIARRGGNGTIRSPRVELQLKCSSQEILREGSLHFPLKRKNYDDLRGENIHVPRILVIVLVPHELENWLSHTEARLELRRCGYWMSLRDYPATSNEETVTIKMPRDNQFTVEQLKGMMDRIGDGKVP